MPSNPIGSIKLNQRSHKTLVSSSRQLGWNGILVEQYHILQLQVKLNVLPDPIIGSSYPFFGDSY